MVFHWKGVPPSGRRLLVDLLEQAVELTRLHVAGELGTNPAGMNRRCAHAPTAMAPIELHREQDVGRLRAAVGGKGLVARLLEARVFQIDIREAVPGRGQVDQPPAGAEQRGDAIHEHEVAEMIRAELALEAVGRAGRRASP